MKIELGKFYKTKDGRKVQVVFITDHRATLDYLTVEYQGGSYITTWVSLANISEEWVEPRPKVLRAQYLILEDTSGTRPYITPELFTEQEMETEKQLIGDIGQTYIRLPETEREFDA